MLVQGSPISAMVAASSTETAAQPEVGQVLQGMIQATDEGLFFVAGRLRAPLPNGAGLNPGQRTTATVVARTQNGAIQLRITPQETTPASTPASSSTPAQTALAAMAETMLRALGVVELPEQVASLLPAQLPPTADIARAALSLFVVREELGSEIAVVVKRIAEALQQGIPVREETRAALSLLSQLNASEPDSLEAVLRQWVDDARTPTEARVARALAFGQPERLSELLQTDVRAALTQVRDDPALARFLAERGHGRSFQDTVARIADRVAGSQLQNVRGTDIPYWVTELPFAPGSPIRDGLIHFLPEGRCGSAQAGSDYATIALDLSTTRLGDLWITLRVGDGNCQCRIQAKEAPAVTALRNAAQELETGFSQAGYPHASVQVAEWDGNRLRETAILLRRYAGLQVQV